MLYRLFLIISFFYQTTILGNDKVKEWIETEQYAKAIEFSEKLEKNNVLTLSILKAKYALKKYFNFEKELLSLKNKSKNTDKEIYDECSILYVKYLFDVSKNNDALAILEKLSLKDTFLLAEKYNLLGLIYQSENKFKESNKYFDKAIDYLSKNNTRKYVIYHGLVCNNKASNFYYQSELALAEIWYKKALSLYHKYPNATKGKIAKANYNLSLIYADRSENYKALELLEEALKNSISIFGEQHSMVAECYAMLGSIYIYFNQLDKALDYFNRDKNISIGIYGEKNLNVAYSYFDCGMVYNQLKDYYLPSDI